MNPVNAVNAVIAMIAIRAATAVHPSRPRACFVAVASLALIVASSLAMLPRAEAAAKTTDTSKSDKPQDYAYALPLQLSGKQGVVALRLPQAVYLNAKTAELDDLRVFDAKGVAQPHTLYRPPPEKQAQRGVLPATIFAVRGGSATAAGKKPLDIDIRTRADGSIQSVQARTTSHAQGDSAAISHLILDFGAGASARKTSPVRFESLRFSPPRDRNNYSATVWLETSDDLKHWLPAGVAELSWLSNDSAQTLSSNRLELSPQSFRYARLSWTRGEPVLFPAILGDTLTLQSSEPARDTLRLKPEPGKQPGDLLYRAGIALPVEQFGVRLQETNIVYPMALGHYAERPSREVGKATEWAFQPQWRVTFYQITQDGQTRRSGTVNIAPNHRNEWVIRPLNDAATAQPELELSWQPATLIFLAGGTPPYSMHFGRSDATPASQPLGQVAPGFSARELKQLEQAQVGELQVVHPDAESESAARKAAGAARMRTFLLWGVLLLGVAVLGGMAWRLARQIRTA